jgi:chitinase
MATKAGAPAHKIIVGMPMYGRSFQMVQPGCWGPDCRFVGPESGATPGRCTNESGYISNYEIREIIAADPSVMVHTDEHGDILVYNGNQWVSWLSKSSYDARESWIKGLNFGGISDWALDLDDEYGTDPGISTTSRISNNTQISTGIWTNNTRTNDIASIQTFIDTQTGVSNNQISIQTQVSQFLIDTISFAPTTTGSNQPIPTIDATTMRT